MIFESHTLRRFGLIAVLAAVWLAAGADDLWGQQTNGSLASSGYAGWSSAPAAVPASTSSVDESLDSGAMSGFSYPQSQSPSLYVPQGTSPIQSDQPQGFVRLETSRTAPLLDFVNRQSDKEILTMLPPDHSMVYPELVVGLSFVRPA